tara:strand:+ start:72 stop:1088 length:1017 start_codon:yes stop_codon:yes gene_type:complete
LNYYCQHIDLDNKKEWEELVKNNPAGGFHQSFDWAVFKQSTNWQSYKIGVYDKDKLVAGALVLKFAFSNGTNFLYLPEGPILELNNEKKAYWQWRALETAIHSIVSLDKDNKTTHIRIEPRAEKVPEFLLHRFSKAPINLQPRHTEEINLDQTQEELLKNMKQKCRYNIKLSQKNGVQVKELPLSEIQIFFKLYKDTLKRNKFDGQSLEFFKNYIQSCSDFSKLFVAYKDQEVLASSITIFYGDRVTYLYGASSNQNKKLMAPYALHWHIIQHAKKLSFKTYDFWGIAKDSKDENHPWYGITRFKKQFGGTQQNFIGAYDYIINPELYDEFVKKHELN